MVGALKNQPEDIKLVRSCSIWRALEDIGDVPTMQILEAFWLGERRFDGFQKRTGLPKTQLSQRLKRMVARGIFRKRLYCARPPRYDYVLTGKSRDLYWVALAMLRWEIRWGARAAAHVVHLHHTRCGARDIGLVPLSLATQQEFSARTVRWQHGPGLGWISHEHDRRHRPRAKEAGPRNTILDTTVRVVGDRWGTLILRSILTGYRKFDEIQKDTGMATNILADRLQWLAEIGLVFKESYSDQPRRFDYRLTPAGIDYYPLLVMLLRWGDRWHATPEGRPMILLDRASDRPLEPVIACSACRQPIEPQDMAFSFEARARTEDA